MSCLHCRFRVLKHHIGSSSNPDLAPEVPSRLLNFVLLVLIFFFFYRIRPFFIVNIIIRFQVVLSNTPSFQANLFDPWHTVLTHTMTNSLHFVCTVVLSVALCLHLCSYSFLRPQQDFSSCFRTKNNSNTLSFAHFTFISSRRSCHITRPT